MRKLSYFLIIAVILLLSSCSNSNNNTEKTTISSSAAPVTADVNTALDLEKPEITSLEFREANSDGFSIFIDKKFIEEFRSFIVNQDYIPVTNSWGTNYAARLVDEKGNTLLKITLGERSVTFDRDVTFRGYRFTGGTAYETKEWIYEYIMNFTNGYVADPVFLTFPAKLRMPLEYYTAELLNKGGSIVNRYETIAGLHDFIDGSIAGKEFEITGGERLYSEEARKAEEARQAGARVIRMEFQTDGSYMRIDSSSKYQEMIRAYPIYLYRDDDNPGLYRLASGGEVLLIKVDKAFDNEFQNLFDKDDATEVRLDAGGVEKLLKEKKPWSMDYLCKNLGMDQWNTREDDKLEKSTIKLANGNGITVLAIKNPYDLRLMFFNSKTGAYTGFLDFGGREAGTGYNTKSAGGYTWIVGNKCRGHGTGENIYNQEWYLLDGNGVKFVLSIPYDAYSVGPYGGYITQADGMRVDKGKAIKLDVDYSLTRVYILDIDGANEYGQVNVKAKKKAEYVWDDATQAFTSEYPTVPGPYSQIAPQGPELSKKCSDILEKNYDRLKSGIEALDSPENEPNRTYKARAYEEFLKDCPDSAKKAALMELLKEKSLADQN